jgi:hypothetical protein
MKKTVFFGLLVMLLLFGNYSILFAQATNPAQRIVGTWTLKGANATWTFDSNGTGTLTPSTNLDWIIVSDKIIIRYDPPLQFSGRTIRREAFTFYFSNDGRTLILLNHNGDVEWLEKRN